MEPIGMEDLSKYDRSMYEQTEGILRRFGNDYITRVLDKFTSLIKTKKGIVLDLACGSGLVADYFKSKLGFNSICLDCSPNAPGLGSGNGVMSKAEQLPLTSQSINIVHFKDALVHIDDKAGLFEEMYRVLKPGGKVLIVSQWFDSPGLFYYRRFINGKLIRESSEINSMEDYYGRVLLCSDKSGVLSDSISPPYFPCCLVDTLRLAKRAGFNLIKNYGWLSPLAEEEWLKEPDSRFVVFLEKPYKKPAFRKRRVQRVI